MADAAVIEGEQRFVIHRDIAPPRFMFQIFHFAAQLLVRLKEGVASLPVALHQRMTNKSSRDSCGSMGP